MGQKHFGFFRFFKLLIVAVTNNTADCFIQGCLVLCLSKAIDKDKIGVTIYRNFAMNIQVFLFLLFKLKGFFDKIKLFFKFISDSITLLCSSAVK